LVGEGLHQGDLLAEEGLDRWLPHRDGADEDTHLGRRDRDQPMKCIAGALSTPAFPITVFRSSPAVHARPSHVGDVE